MKFSEEGFNLILMLLEEALDNATDKNKIKAIELAIEEVETIGTY